MKGFNSQMVFGKFKSEKEFAKYIAKKLDRFPL